MHTKIIKKVIKGYGSQEVSLMYRHYFWNIRWVIIIIMVISVALNLWQSSRCLTNLSADELVLMRRLLFHTRLKMFTVLKIFAQKWCSQALKTHYTHVTVPYWLLSNCLDYISVQLFTNCQEKLFVCQHNLKCLFYGLLFQKLVYCMKLQEWS